MTRVVAVFDSPQALERAIEASTEAGWRTVSICSPAFDEQLLRLAGGAPSPGTTYALAGGALGVMFGFLLTIGTVRQWPGLIVSGKPLIAMPPFLIIVFELAILGASLASVASFLIAARHARRTAGAACNYTTTDHRFTLLVESTATPRRIDDVLRSIGARECRLL